MKAVIETTLAISKIDANTVEAQDLQQYTEQQIDEHCKDLERCIRLTNAKPETSYFPTSLLIIRQLQGMKNENLCRIYGD